MILKAKIGLLLFMALLLFAPFVCAQENPRVTDIDRVRLAEAFRIGDTLGNQIWSGWNKAPFSVLLVTPDNEFLIRHPKPSTDFTLLNYDRLLKSNVYYRKRTQSPQFLNLPRRRHSDHRSWPGRKHGSEDLNTLGCYHAARALSPAAVFATWLFRRGKRIGIESRRPVRYVDVELSLPLRMA